MANKYKQLDIFNIMCANILLKLHNNFPIAINLSFVDIADEGFRETYMENMTPQELHNFHEVFTNTMEWLHGEKFLTGEILGNTGGPKQCLNLRLTLLGLITLNKIPDSLESSSIDKIKNALGDAASTVSKSALSALVTKILGSTITQ